MHQNKSETIFIEGCLDSPTENQPADPYTLRVEGWVRSTQKNISVSKISFNAEGQILGTTSYLFSRKDVCEALGLPSAEKTGFSAILCAPQLRGKRVHFTVRAELNNGSSIELASRWISFKPDDLVQKAFGHLLDPSHTRILNRADVFGSGPSLEQGSEELVSLLSEYLGPAGTTVLDVGCGLGFYGTRLMEIGYAWTGVEPKPEDAKRLSEKGLRFVQGDGYALPFAAASFDSAICVEVLEHITDPHRFVAELRRVVRQRLIISVPNVELIPYMECYAVVPWHMLEGDHKNFFTRHSLASLLNAHFSRVEVVMYGLCPLKKADGGPLFYNLLAVADL